MDDRPYTPKSLAERWGCGEGAVRSVIERGELRCFRIGTLIRIRKAEVLRFEAEGGSPVPAVPVPESRVDKVDIRTEARLARLVVGSGAISIGRARRPRSSQPKT